MGDLSVGLQLGLLQKNLNSQPTPSSITPQPILNPPIPSIRETVDLMSAADDTMRNVNNPQTLPPPPALMNQTPLASSTSPIQHNSSNLHRHSFQNGSPSTNGELELFLCFDSNGKHIDRKRLWKKNGSEYKQCGNLHKVAEEVKKLRYTSLKYMVISVGTNDLDEKDHDQVLGELDLLLNDIRRRFVGVKFVINQLIPRNDARNSANLTLVYEISPTNQTSQLHRNTTYRTFQCYTTQNTYLSQRFQYMRKTLLTLCSKHME